MSFIVMTSLCCDVIYKH